MQAQSGPPRLLTGAAGQAIGKVASFPWRWRQPLARIGRQAWEGQD